MYESMLKPLVSRAGIAGELTRFWLLFATLDVLAVAGLLLYNRFFAVETPANVRTAQKIMMGVYAALVLLGGWFFYASTIVPPTPAYRAVVQSVIMLLIGLSGIVIALRHRSL